MSAALLQFQGADGSTSIVDQTGRNWTAQGNAALSTDAPAYGVSSLELPDDTSFIESTDNLAALVPGTGDFAIQIWVDNVTSAFTLYDSGNGILVILANAGQIFLYDNQYGQEADFFTAPYSIDMFSGAPLYICLERVAGSLGAYINTSWIQFGETPMTSDLNAVPSLLTVARRQVAPESRPGIGNVNGLRVVVGSGVHSRANLPAVPSPLDYVEVVPVTGAFVWTEVDDSFSAIGSIGVAGALGWTEANDSFNLLANSIVSGDLDWTESNDLFVMSGSVSAPAVAISGSFHWTEANDTWRIVVSLPIPEDETITTRDFYAYLD